MRKFACFKGKHKVHGKMTVCCYAESYSASDANLKPRLQAMLQANIDEFVKAPVNFDDD